MKTSFLIIAAIFFCLSSAQAYDITTSPRLLPDTNGYRAELDKKGLVLSAGYGGESAHNFSGGTQQLTEYTDQWVLAADIDFEKLENWKGLTGQFVIDDRNGQNLGADAGIGNDMLIQEVYGRGQTWHTTHFWLNQKFFGDLIEWKAGRLTVGQDFADFSCDFQNLTFCGSQPGNLVGSYWLNWPTSVWATRVKYNATENTNWQIGAYQVNSTYVDDDYARKNILNINNPSGANGTLIPFEFAWTPKVHSQPGSYKFGAWYNTAAGADLSEDINHNQRGMTGAAPFQHNGQYGAYINFEQQITGTDRAPELSVFLNISQADRDTAAVDRQISLGTQYHGPFGRPLDAAAVAIGATDNNGRYANFVREQNAATGKNQIVGDGNEYVTEVYYSYVPIASVFLRPNLQYILQPGGTKDNKDAFLLGLKTGVNF